MIFLYYGQFEHYGYCENWVADAIDRNGHHCLRVRRTPWFDESRLIMIARQNKATHLLLSKCPEVTAEQLQALKTSGLKIVFWTFDWMREPEAWKWYKPLAQMADVCFQTDGYGENDAYLKDGINRIELHQGCVPGLHEVPATGNTADSEFGSTLAFIGSNYTQRRHSLVYALETIGVLKGGFCKWGEPGEQVWGHEFAAAVYYSSIVVGDNFVNDVAGYWSDRVYLTLACGGFFLTAYVPGLENRFTNHEHLVWWESFDELESLIDYYLPREAKRKAIALNGRRKVMAYDTYDRRIQQLTAELERLK